MSWDYTYLGLGLQVWLVNLIILHLSEDTHFGLRISKGCYFGLWLFYLLRFHYLRLIVMGNLGYIEEGTMLRWGLLLWLFEEIPWTIQCFSLLCSKLLACNQREFAISEQSFIALATLRIGHFLYLFDWAESLVIEPEHIQYWWALTKTTNLLHECIVYDL